MKVSSHKNIALFSIPNSPLFLWHYCIFAIFHLLLVFHPECLSTVFKILFPTVLSTAFWFFVNSPTYVFLHQIMFHTKRSPILPKPFNHIPTFLRMTLNNETLRSNGFQPDMIACSNTVMLNTNYAEALFPLYIFALILRFLACLRFLPWDKHYESIGYILSQILMKRQFAG